MSEIRLDVEYKTYCHYEKSESKLMMLDGLITRTVMWDRGVTHEENLIKYTKMCEGKTIVPTVYGIYHAHRLENRPYIKQTIFSLQ